MDMQVHRKPTSHPSLTDRTSGHMVEGSVSERTFSVSVWCYTFGSVGTVLLNVEMGVFGYSMPNGWEDALRNFFFSALLSSDFVLFSFSLILSWHYGLLWSFFLISRNFFAAFSKKFKNLNFY